LRDVRINFLVGSGIKILLMILRGFDVLVSGLRGEFEFWILIP